MPPHQVLASDENTQNSAFDVKKRLANYAPSLWGDHFLSYASMEVDGKLVQCIQVLKEEVKIMLSAAVNQPASHILRLMDNIQRLGLSYHFENEIKAALGHVYESEDLENDGDLYTTALHFRLLRQQGYNISCDVFNKFKESKGTFKESLLSDVVGLLSLYEATHLNVHNEDILEEALAFTSTHLKHAAPSPLSEQATHALYQPLWKGFSRIEARHYLSIYEQDDSHNQTLLTLAKLDFNLVQKVHQKELSDMTRWWKDLDFVNKLPNFARDRVVEAYFWTAATFFEPEYFFSRVIVCRYCALTTILDDLYDNYGTYEDLKLFTQAVERWDSSAGDKLPEYMKVCFKGLLDSYSEFEEQLMNGGKLYCVNYAREAIKLQLRAYLQEAKWVKENYTPTMDEYIPNALDASLYPMAITAFVGMGDFVTKDNMEWVLNNPKIMRATSLIARLKNDMVGHKQILNLGLSVYKFEQNKDASAVECYMNQYGVTDEEAKIELYKQINAAWKDINQDWLDLCSSSSSTPKPLVQIILNLARSSEVIYKNEKDAYTDCETGLMGDLISLFIEPVPV